MKKSNQKKVNKLKRISVVPHIIMLLIFVTLVGVMAASFIEVFLIYIVGDRIDNAEVTTTKLASFIESQIPDDGRDFTVTLYDWETDDYAILDNDTNEFVVSSNREIVLENYVTLGIGDQRAYFDSINGLPVAEVFENSEINLVDVFFESLGSVNLEEIADPGALNRDMITFHAWLVQPLKDGRYTLYNSSDIVLRVKDVLYMLVVISIMGLMVAIPMILYMITLIVSVVNQKKSARLLYYDPITGGENWLYFENRGEGIIKKSKRNGKKYAMVSLRMERYQSFCACYGAASGEDVIERINAAIKVSLKKRKELFARYSEAEFSLLLLMDSVEGVNSRVAELKAALIKVLAPYKVDFTVGISEAKIGEKIDALYGNASLARKSIQPNSTEKIAWFDEKLREEQLWERYVEENMDRALNEGELHVYLQPKYNAESEKLGGAEALIRWISKEKGFIGPGKFIPIFEKNGFITHIDDFMISSVAKLQAQWVKEGRNVVPISVNVSRAHFTQMDLAEHICKLVEDAGAPKELIELELTESAFFEDKDVLIDTVDKLKSMGFKVSMDDFGAGYSSLNSLKDLKLDVLKIDADFFRGREENEQRGSLIVSETIQLAKSLGMTTVAEGIESSEQVEFLAKSGCDLIQGYYFAKPMPVNEYEERMERG